MKIELEKSSGRAKCRSLTCLKKPEFINENGRIKKDTTCAILWMESASGWNASFYCRDCLEKVHNDVKMQLNPALWVFL